MCKDCGGYFRTGYRACQKCNYRFMAGLSLETQQLMHKLRLASSAIHTNTPSRELVLLAGEAHKLDEHIKEFIGRLIEARNNMTEHTTTCHACTNTVSLVPFIEDMEHLRRAYLNRAREYSDVSEYFIKPIEATIAALRAGDTNQAAQEIIRIDDWCNVVSDGPGTRNGQILVFLGLAS